MPPALDSQKNDLEKVFLASYERLNPAQKEAVDIIEGPVMVIAGPGTGKTQILAMRIAKILSNPDLQVSPNNILCLTFTESATAAMRNRLISIIGESAYYVRIHTFHSFCNEIIKDNPHKFFSINPISELEQIEIFNELIDKLDPNSPIKPFGDPYVYRKDLINAIKILKRESVTAEELSAKTVACETFIGKNADMIEAFTARNARSIKDHECDEFLEKLYVSNIDSDYVPLFRDFWGRASKIAEFKASIKDFYEKNLREIPKQKELVKLYLAYEAKLKASKLYDFEDMILRVLNQFKNDDELLGSYQEQFQYILVDEFQDTNGAQNRILEYLTGGIEAKLNPRAYQENPNIFVVGDDDQSIYRFQGASVENIVYFLKRYQTYGKRIVLEQNYRSQQNILDVAQASINNNNSRISNLVSGISKRLSSSGTAGDFELAPLEIHQSPSLEDEIFHIATRVKELIDTGTQPAEIAILFRENKEAIPLMNYFSRLGINASFEAGENILEDTEICQLIDLLKVIEKPESSSLLFNILNYDFLFEALGLSIVDIFKLNATRRMEKDDKKSFIYYLLEDEKFKKFAEKIIEANRLSVSLRADDLLERVIKDFNFLDYSLKQANYIHRINRLESLFAEVRDLITSPTRKYKEETQKVLRLGDLISHLQLIQSEDLKIKAKALNLDSNAVRLMTAHKSKGLEFEHVFIHACLDKRWGNKVNRSKLKLPPLLISETESLLDNSVNEDERRLFYVALTRAKHKAYLHYHSENAKSQETVKSLFISELLSLSKEILVKIENKASEENLKQRFDVHFSDRIDRHIEEEKAYLDSLLRDYKLSVTHLNNFLKCKRLFFYQNLLHVPAAKSKSASFGTAVHEALHRLFSASNPSLGFLLESFKEQLEKQRLTELEHNDCLGVGTKALTEYFNKYWQNANKNTLLEFDFSGFGVNVAGVTLTGKLDKVEILDEAKNVMVVDYKTGNPASKSASLKPGGDYHRQIVFYQLLCDLAAAKAGFKYKMVVGEIDFVQRDSYDKFHKHKITVDGSEMETLKTEISEMMSELKKHNFCKTEDLSLCSNCNFKNICGR